MRDHRHVEVRAYGPLVDLLGRAHVEVPVGEPRSVKDLIESVGLPHPEIGLLLVDGRTVGFEHRMVGGERVAAYPPLTSLRPEGSLWPRPPEPRRFALDVHLGALARRLRLLGFDTWYTTEADDRQLARIATNDDRILLTRDRGLLMRREIVHGYCPRSHDPDAQLLEVARRYGLAPRARSLTRCPRCNGVLVPATAAEVRQRVPARSREAFDRFATCPGCGQVYWPGSHVDALAARFDGLFDDRVR